MKCAVGNKAWQSDPWRGMIFVQVSQGKGQVPVLCFSLGEEECFILVSRLGGSLWSFLISKLAVGTHSFSQEKQTKSQNVWDCLGFSPSGSTHLGRSTSPNPGMSLELLALESAAIHHLAGAASGDPLPAGKSFPGHSAIPVNLKRLPKPLEF